MREINILVMSGGGSKAISYIGVIKRMEELRVQNKIILNINEVCGVSAGSIIGLLYLLGYTYEELEQEVVNKKLEHLKDIRISNFFTNYGIDSGKNIMNWIESLLVRKGYDKNITFKQLYDMINKKFVIMATNLNKYKHTFFDYINTPDISILKAVRMSISIPFYFTCERYNNDVHVDGALIENYPIKMYKDNLKNVLGFKIINYGELKEHSVEYKINSIDTFIYNVIYCFIVQKERQTTLNDEYKMHTIYIYLDDKNAVNFSMTGEDKKNMIKKGYEASCDYFNRYLVFGEHEHEHEHEDEDEDEDEDEVEVEVEKEVA